jgi:tRNA G37 N-methylase Trm5
MRTSIVAMWVVSALAAAPVSFAQQSPVPSERPPSTATMAVSDAELETFTTIYVDLLDTAEKFETEMKSAQTEEQALAIRERIETESVEKVAKRGWTPQKFNSVGDAINNNPDLADKAAKLIDEKN